MKAIDLLSALQAIGATDEQVFDTLTDSRGNSAAIVLKGTVLIGLATGSDGFAQVVIHDHESEEDAQTCAQSKMDDSRELLAEYEAMLASTTAARSQLANMLNDLTGGMWV